ncbi:MAG: protein-S-isoprenylcysteine O-methyltransferase Ste14 [Rhodothermales bacterium]|jgi:protein-S-isoprenylcysteine O-methyltransferase Ste14
MEQKRKIVPPVYLLIALILLFALHRCEPIASFAHPTLMYFGATLAAFGLGMTVMSAGLFKKVGTGIVPFDEATVLVTAGFYRFSRNPMYLGMVMLLLGIALTLGSAGSLLPIPLFIWVIHNNFILGEENFLLEAFGDEFLAYKEKVRRWI